MFRNIALAIAMTISAPVSAGTIIHSIHGTFEAPHYDYLDFDGRSVGVEGPGAYLFTLTLSDSNFSTLRGDIYRRFAFYNVCNGVVCGGEEGEAVGASLSFAGLDTYTATVRLPGERISSTPEFTRIDLPDRTGAILMGVAGAISSIDWTLTVEAIPEPENWTMMICGFVMLGTIRRRHVSALG